MIKSLEDIPISYRDLKCDNHGVPLLIQDIRYAYGGMWFVARFFNGGVKRFTTDSVCPSLGLTQKRPDRMQMLQAENSIFNLAIEYWAEWYPIDDLQEY